MVHCLQAAGPAHAGDRVGAQQQNEPMLPDHRVVELRRVRMWRFANRVVDRQQILSGLVAGLEAHRAGLRRTGD